MSSLIYQRCRHHPAREAVVRCPECRRFYCRECATEHRGRMMCAGCVARLADQPGRKRHRLGGVLWTASALGGLLLAWLLFYYLGVTLARIPSDFFGGPA
jgi:ANCHR-like B-box zinc-binding protein